MKSAVVMRSKNERPFLDRCLIALSEQTEPFNLYAVDSGSTDGSKELIQSVHPKIFEEINPEEYRPGPVLNRMIEKTDEPIIVLLNADAIPQGKDWLKTLIEPIVKNRADASMSRQIPRKDATFISAYDLKRAFDPVIVAKQPFFFSAVSCAFKRSLWKEVPFYSDGFSEDAVFCRQAKQKGYRFEYAADSVVEHSHNYSLKSWHRRNFIEGAALSSMFSEDASISDEVFGFCKESARDLIEAFRQFQIDQIPYNILYRAVAHTGLWQGKRSGNGKVF